MSKTFYDPSALKSAKEHFINENKERKANREEHRKASPTYNGFVSNAVIDPKRDGVYNKPVIKGGVQQVPGGLGWGIERNHLIAENHILTDDMRVDSYPIAKGHIQTFDKSKNNLFTRYTGERAAKVDKDLNVDPQLYF